MQITSLSEKADQSSAFRRLFMEEAEFNDSCPLNDFFGIFRVGVNRWDYFFQVLPGATFIAAQGTRDFTDG